jgi:hypothetical protein
MVIQKRDGEKPDRSVCCKGDLCLTAKEEKFRMPFRFVVCRVNCANLIETFEISAARCTAHQFGFMDTIAGTSHVCALIICCQSLPGALQIQQSTAFQEPRNSSILVIFSRIRRLRSCFAAFTSGLE